MKPIHRGFPSRFKDIRGQIALSRKDLARELGVTFPTINRWENGRAKPSKLARAQLDVFFERKHASWSGQRCDAVFQCDFYRQDRRMSGRVAP
jgi:putative transcriptional regulator